MVIWKQEESSDTFEVHRQDCECLRFETCLGPGLRRDDGEGRIARATTVFVVMLVWVPACAGMTNWSGEAAHMPTAVMAAEAAFQSRLLYERCLWLGWIPAALDDGGIKQNTF